MKLRKFFEKITTNNSFLLLIIFLLVFILRAYYIKEVVLNTDEGVYFTVAQDIANGGVFYENFWDAKGPILSFILTLPINFFGNNIFALRLFTSVYLLISMFFVYLISKIFLSGKINLIPPLIYGLFFTTTKFGGLAVTGEIYYMLFIVVAIFCFMKSLQKNRPANLGFFWCGVFCAVAILIKATAIFPILTFPIFLIFQKTRRKQVTWQSLSKQLLFLFLGGLTITSIILIYFLRHGLLREFYEIYYVYNSHYVGSTSAIQGLKKFGRFWYEILTEKFDLITSLAVVTNLFLIFQRISSKTKRDFYYFLLILTFCSLVGVYWGRSMDVNYFLPMSLPFSLTIGLALSQIKITRKVLEKVVFLVFLFTSLIGLLYPIFYKSGFYHNNENETYLEVVDYIAQNTKETDTIFVLYGQPMIYFLTERKAPTKYFYWLHHADRWGRILNLEKNTLGIFSKNKPKYFVYTIQKEGLKSDYLEKYMKENYHLEKTIDNYSIYKANELN